MVAVFALGVFAQDAVPPPIEPEPTEISDAPVEYHASPAVIQEESEPNFFVKIWNWIAANWLEIGASGIGLMGIIEIVVRLTPSEKDNAAFAWLRSAIDWLIPNLKTGGGRHPSPTAEA